MRDNYVREDYDEGTKSKYKSSRFDNSARKVLSGALLHSNDESGPSKKLDATGQFAAKEKDSAEQEEPKDDKASAPDKADAGKKQPKDRNSAINFSSVDPLQAAAAEHESDDDADKSAQVVFEQNVRTRKRKRHYKKERQTMAAMARETMLMSG